MLWVVLGLLGCSAPPEIDGETSYISDSCGALTKQITVRSLPNMLITLHRDDEAIAEYRTDALGIMQVRWPVTSLAGVQARVGSPNNYGAVELSDPPPTLEPVWREGRVDHLRCLQGAECTVSLEGRRLQLQSERARVALSIGEQAAATGEGAVTQALSDEQLRQFSLSVSEESSCPSVAGPPLTVEVDGERRVAGWVLSRSQALTAISDAIVDDGMSIASTDSHVVVVQQVVADSAPDTGELAAFDASKPVSVTAPLDVRTPQNIRAVLRLVLSRVLDPSSCDDGENTVGWRLAASLTNAQSGETTERTFAGPPSDCLAITDIQPTADDAVDEAETWAASVVGSW